MLKAALLPIYRLGISPTDANLSNCHVVGDRIVVVEHEQDERLDEDSGHSLEDRVDGLVDSIMWFHRRLHEPKKEVAVDGDIKAQREWEAKYGAAALGVRSGRC
jgi:hypothetical protein